MKSNTIELFVGERASGYDQFVATWIPHYDVFLDSLPKILNQHTNKTLLAVGCGTGNEIERFIDNDSKWIITGVDPSAPMIEQAKHKFKQNNHVTLIHGLVTDVPKGNYGVATLLLVLHFLDDNGSKLHLLKSIADKLQTGATLIIFDITGDQSHIKANLSILQALLPNGIDPAQIAHRKHRISCELPIISPERLTALLQEAGFAVPCRFFSSAIYAGFITYKL